MRYQLEINLPYFWFDRTEGRCAFIDTLIICFAYGNWCLGGIGAGSCELLLVLHPDDCVQQICPVFAWLSHELFPPARTMLHQHIHALCIKVHWTVKL